METPMAQPKITALFYSAYGTNHQIASHAAQAMQAAGAEVRLRRARETAPAEAVNSQEGWKATAERVREIPEIGVDDMAWADGYWISAPARYGVPASQLRAFIDTLGPLWSKGGLAGKGFSATATTQNPNGGVEQTLISLYTTAMHWGCVLVPPGYTDASIYAAHGCPYGYATTAGGFDDAGRAAVAHQARRLVEMTARIRG
jgi:NAD(P)H dehydrogenase (quinone)